MSSGPAQPTLRPPGSEDKHPDRAANAQNRKLIIWGLMALLLILVLVVLFVLPAKISQVEQSPVIAKEAKQAALKPAPDISGVAQHDAGLALQHFLRLRAQPDLQEAEIWAPKTWSEAMTSAELGDEHYGHHRFQQALSTYQGASQQLEQLQADRPQLLSDTLASAQASLKKNQVAPAIAAFERVLAMQSNHLEAQTGLAQARVREQILALMVEGKYAQTEGKLAVATKAYTTALELDADFQPARTALDIVTEALASQAYQSAMSEALSALDSGDLSTANRALQTAATIQPGTAELLDAQQRLRDAQRQSTLNSLRKQALDYAEKENWSGAIKRYEKALSIDQQATFARSGLALARSRQKLHTQLDHYLESPERLASDGPLDNAQSLLDSNLGSPVNEPLLAGKLTSLRKAVELASTPVTLLIESDNLTRVTIYHVGRLGAFENKQIKLRPGQYTVIGVREGYRDVRKTIAVTPGTAARISIRCEERF